jgi:hypothetical protein
MVAINLRGLWRVLVVVFVLAAAMTVVAASIEESHAHDCRVAAEMAKPAPHADLGFVPDKRQGGRDLGVNLNGFDVQPGHVLSPEQAAALGLPLGPADESAQCPKTGYSVLLGVLGIVAEFAVLFGGGLVVRWIYRGFLN